MWGAAAVLAAIVIGRGWMVPRRTPPGAPAQPVRVTPLATYPGVKDFPAISPRRQRRRLLLAQAGHQQLRSVRASGGRRPAGAANDEPGRRLLPVVVAGRADDRLRPRHARSAPTSIIAIPTLGGPEQRIASWGGAFFGPAWTADGRHLIVNDRARPGEPLSLFTVSLDTGEKRPFVALPAGFTGIGDVAAVFSPDGRKLLVYRLVANLSGDLFIQPLSADGAPEGAPSQLTRPHLWVNGLGFAPDGASVLFSGVREHAQALWRVSIEFPGLPIERHRVRGAGRGLRCRLLAANRLVFERRSPDSNVMRLDLETRTAMPLQFLNSTREDMWPQYSPDGRQIALISTRSGQLEIWVCDSAGGDPCSSRATRAASARRRDGRRTAAALRWCPPRARGGCRRSYRPIAVRLAPLATGATSSDESVPDMVAGRPLDLLLVDAERDE